MEKGIYVVHGVTELAFSPALGKQRQEDQYEFKANLVYIASSRPAMVTYGDLVSKQQQ